MRTTIHIPEPMSSMVEGIQQQSGLTVSEIVRTALEFYLLVRVSAGPAARLPASEPVPQPAAIPQPAPPPYEAPRNPTPMRFQPLPIRTPEERQAIIDRIAKGGAENESLKRKTAPDA